MRAKKQTAARKSKPTGNRKAESKPASKVLFPVPDLLQLDARYGVDAHKHPLFWPTMEARCAVAGLMEIPVSGNEMTAIPTLAQVADNLRNAGTDHTPRFWREMLHALVDWDAEWFRAVARQLEIQKQGPRHLEPYWFAQAVFFLRNRGLDWRNFTKEILRRTALRMWALHDAAMRAAPNLGNRYFQPGPLMEMKLCAVAKMLGRDDAEELRRELNAFCSSHDGKAWQRAWKAWEITLPQGKAGRKRRDEGEFFPAEITDKKSRRRPG